MANLFVGVVTRESINNALSCGINAEQIISYLQQHAHPHVATRIPIVPDTVSDQVRLWEHDAQRVQQHSAVLYDDFPSKEVFEAVYTEAKKRAALLWRHPNDLKLAVKMEAHDELRVFVRKQTQASG